MMDRTTTGKEYAAALFSLAKEAGAEQAYYDALCTVKEQFDANAEYPYLLDSPDIPAQKRQELIAQAFSDALPQDVLAFLQLLSAQRRMELFPECIAEYAVMHRRENAVLRAKISSALPLTDAQKSAVTAALERRCGRRVQPEFAVDAALLGGVRVETDDLILDGSLRAGLSNMKGVIDR